MLPAFNIDRLFGLPLAAGVTLRSMGGAAGPAGTCVPTSGDASRDPSRDTPAAGTAAGTAGEAVERTGDADLGGFPLADEAELAAEATTAGTAAGIRPPRRSTARAAA